jgi:hypothetical protein
MKNGTSLEGIWVSRFIGGKELDVRLEGLGKQGQVIKKYIGDISKIEFIHTTQDNNVKVCPKCSRKYTDEEWKFCPYDGTPLEFLKDLLQTHSPENSKKSVKEE